MTTFTNGPAAGKTLRLRRAPIFLRVVVGPCNGVDALDQLDDIPLPSEKPYAYRRLTYDGAMHINSRDSRGRHNGRFFTIASYELVEPQPLDGTMRDNKAWAAWTEARWAEEQERKMEDRKDAEAQGK